MAPTLIRSLALSLASAMALATAPIRAEDSNGGAAADATGAIEGRVDHRFVRLAPAAVYLEEILGRTWEPPSEAASVSQVDQVFEPRVLLVLVGTRVEFPNDDAIRHSVYSPELSVQPFDLGAYRPGETRSVVFDSTGVVPILCSIHSEMKGYLVVCPTPYFATTGETGSFRIEGIPPGVHHITVWHERLERSTLPVRVEPGRVATIDFTGLVEKPGR